MIEANTVTWRILDASNTRVGDVVQKDITVPAAAAVAPGLVSYLPRK